MRILQTQQTDSQAVFYSTCIPVIGGKATKGWHIKLSSFSCRDDDCCTAVEKDNEEGRETNFQTEKAIVWMCEYEENEDVANRGNSRKLSAKLRRPSEALRIKTYFLYTRKRVWRLSFSNCNEMVNPKPQSMTTLQTFHQWWDRMAYWLSNCSTVAKNW